MEKKHMTFEELKEKAKELDATVSSGVVIYKSVKFLENGEIETDGRIFSAEQMYDVLEALMNDKTLESRMIWKELQNRAKELGAEVAASGTIYYSHLMFEKDGGIYLDPAELDEDCNTVPCISSDRTCDEMYAMMKALRTDK